MTDVNPTDLLHEAFGDNLEEITRSLLDTIVDGPSDTVVLDAQAASDGSDVEVWLSTNLTEDELDAVESLYRVREVGVYGDPALAGTEAGGNLDGTVYLHLRPDLD